MLKSCDIKEFCGRNGQLKGEVKEGVPQNIALRIESSCQKSVGTLIENTQTNQ